MNNERRKQLDKVAALLSEARGELENIASDEREAFDNMPEGLQQSEKGERASEIADSLDDCVSRLEDVESDLESVRE